MFSHSSVLRKKYFANAAGGFSLVELLVSIGIVVLVLSIVVARQQAFNSAVLLRSQAYEIALAMREVQLGAISSVGDGSGDFRSVQGAYFNTVDPDNQEYRLFRDGTPSNRFPDAGEDIGLSGVLDPRFEIRDIEPSSVGSDVAIVFRRPNFDAQFITDDTGAEAFVPAVTLTIAAKGAPGNVCGQDIRQIEIRATGQIAVLEC